MDWYPLYNSLRIAAIACVAVFFTGIFAAYYVAKLPRLVKGLLDVVLTLPMVLPPTVVGYFLLLLFGVKRPFGIFLARFGIKVPMTWWSAVFAAAKTVSWTLSPEASEEAAAEDAVLDAVELEEPPQAARPSAAAPTPAAFRKLRREIRFILCCLHHFVPFKHSRANRLCPKDCVFFCLQYKFFRFLAQEVCCFIFYRCCFLKNSSSKSAKNLLKVSA